MKEHSFEYNTFIGGWYIPENVCDDLIKYFIDNKAKHISGQSGKVGNVNEEVKKCNEMYIGGKIDNNNEIINKYFKNLCQVLNLYLKKYDDANKTESFSITQLVKIQHYNPGDGYYGYHTENDGFGINRNRHLVFMTYLNDVNEGGGTEFKYQKLISPAKKGLTLIWPAAWTHTHRGQVSKTQHKYICTGWYSFNE